MDALELLEQLTEIGANARADGTELAVLFPEERRSDVERLAPEIRRLKPDLLEALRRENYEQLWTDPYWIAAVQAQAHLREFWPFGLRERLEKVAPDLYALLDVELPREIDRVWDAGGPLTEFRRALDRWVEAHREAASKCGHLVDRFWGVDETWPRGFHEG